MEHYFDFQNYWIILKRRSWIALLAFFSVLGTSAFVLSLQKPLYESTGTLLLKRQSATNSLTGLKDDVNSLEPVLERGNPLQTESEVIRSNLVIQSTLSQLKRQFEIELTPESLRQDLTISPIQAADILSLSYQSTNAETAALVLNTLMETYLQEHIRLQKDEAVIARQFLESKLLESQNRIDRLRESLRDFKEGNQILSIPLEIQSTADLMQELQQQISDTEAQLAYIDAQSNSIQQKLGMSVQQAIVMTALSQSPGIQNTLTEIQSVETQLADQLSRYREGYPAINNLRNKRQNLEQLLQARIFQTTGIELSSDEFFLMDQLNQELSSDLVKLDSERSGLSDELQKLYATQKQYLQNIESLPLLDKQQSELEQQLEDAKASHAHLLPRLQESEIAESQNAGNVRIISPAIVPQKAVSFGQAYLLVSISLATLVTGLAVYIAESTDKRIRDIAQIKQIFGLPILALIPTMQKELSPTNIVNSKTQRSKELGPLLTNDDQSSFAETYRLLQMNLKPRSNEKLLQVITVTSSVNQEGKSTVSSNLALALARRDCHILLVDANLHASSPYPSLHQIWQLPRKPGLSDIIVDQQDPYKILHKSVVKNLDILTSGNACESSAELLDSESISVLIRKYSDSYDFIVVDTPPIMKSVDAIRLSQIADTTLVVARPNHLDIDKATASSSMFEKHFSNILGIVVNDVPVDDMLVNVGQVASV